MLSIDAFKKGLAQAQRQKTSQTLGDRTAYIGASDIGQCPRKAILSKALPKPYDLKTLLNFERGHLAEEIVATALHEAQPVRQMELSADIPYCTECRWWSHHAPVKNSTHCPDCGNPLSLLPLKAHCDFVFEQDDLILECKSSNLVMQPSWEDQLQTQLFLYRHCLDKEAQGEILIMDLTRGGVYFSDPYRLDQDKIPDIIERAIEIWEGVDAATLSQDPENLSLKTEPGPLCGFCDYLGTCPAFLGEELPIELTDIFSRIPGSE